MTFIGIIADYKNFENIKEHLKSKEISLIHISKKSIENIKNIRFETIIIDSDLDNFKAEKNIVESFCKNAKYIVINTDINLKFNLSKQNKATIVTYGLNQKATVTVSSLTDTDILIYLQRDITNIKNKKIEVGEKQIKMNEKSKLKTYEILIIYIICLINNYDIIEQI